MNSNKKFIEWKKEEEKKYPRSENENDIRWEKYATLLDLMHADDYNNTEEELSGELNYGE